MTKNLDILESLPEEISERFKIITKLGEGAFGKVYKVKDNKGEVYALKILNINKLVEKDGKKGDAKRRFIREAKILTRCKHDNLINIKEMGGEKSAPYLLMEYVEGKNLEDFIKEKEKLSFEEIMKKSESILNALHYIHSKGLVHRDLKPGNILIEEKSGRVILIDFGLTKDLLTDSKHTDTGTSMGTPLYMSPEQFQDSSRADLRNDIYAFGVFLFEMAAGKVPFEGNSPIEIMYKHFNEKVPNIRDIRPDLPPGFENIIFKALEKKPDKRYQSADEFLAALKEVEARTSQAIEKEKRSPKNNLFKYLLYLLVIIAAAAFILINPLGIGKKGISPEKQYLTYISSAEQFKQAGEFEKAPDELEKAKIIKDTAEIKELEAGIQRNSMKKDFQVLEEILKGEAAKEKKLAACRDFLSKHQNIPGNDETKLLVSRTNELITRLEKEINTEKIMEQYQKHFAAAVEHFNKGELDKAYESVKSAQELKNTPEAKELEGKIINGFISAVENYYKQANYPGARKSLDHAKKIIPGRNFQDLEQAIELLKEMPAHVQAVLRESKIKKTRIKKINNWWQADFGDGIVMVYIPKGTFKKGNSADIKTLQDIELDDFWMGKTEVSEAQYMKFTRETGTNYPEGIERKGNDYPIVGISWHDAAAYCRWLSGKTGLEFKLPSENQWEKAARGTDGRKYPWGNKEPDRNLANFLNPSTSTGKVNSHPRGASPYGLLNMAGNAAEWCGDVLTDKERGRRPARGGSFYNNAQDIACYSRRTWSPSERINTLGFRVCLGMKRGKIGR